MDKLLGFMGMTVGGWLGWAIGIRFSFLAAVFLSIIGTGVGLYVGRRIAQELF